MLGSLCFKSIKWQWNPIGWRFLPFDPPQCQASRPLRQGLRRSGGQISVYAVQTVCLWDTVTAHGPGNPHSHHFPQNLTRLQSPGIMFDKINVAYSNVTDTRKISLKCFPKIPANFSGSRKDEQWERSGGRSFFSQKEGTLEKLWECGYNTAKSDWHERHPTWEQHSYYCSEYCGFVHLKPRNDCIHVQLDVIYTAY